MSGSRHIFETLVQIRDGKDGLPDPWPALLGQVLDHAWDDELKHYQECDEGMGLDDEAAVAHARQQGGAS